MEVSLQISSSDSFKNSEEDSMESLCQQALRGRDALLEWMAVYFYMVLPVLS